MQIFKEKKWRKKTLEIFIWNFNDMQLFLMFLLWMTEGNQTIYALRLLCVWWIQDMKCETNHIQTAIATRWAHTCYWPCCCWAPLMLGASDSSFIWVGKQYGNFLFRKIYKIFVSSYNLAYDSMCAYHIKLNSPKFRPENFSKRVTETSWHERNETHWTRLAENVK